MTREDFIKGAIQHYEHKLYVDYYYFGWYSNDDDVNKYNSFLIGDVKHTDSTTRHPLGHASYKESLFIDEHGREVEKFFGYSAKVNVNVEIFQYYKISGEEQGQTIMDKLLRNNKTDKIYQKEDIYHENNYTSRYLAADAVLNTFWEDNKDWLSNIRISKMVF